MQRVLIVTSVVLALVLGWLLWSRSSRPAEAAKPVVAVAPAPTPVEPAPAPRAEPVKAPESVEPAKVAEPVAPAPLPAARPTAPKAQPKKPDAAAMNAIFGDRPGSDAPAARPAVATAPAAPPSMAAAPVAHPAPPAPPAPAPAAAPATLRTDLPGAVTGNVLDSRGAPIAGINVVALSADGQEAFESITGDDGFYLIAAMKPGRYVLFPGLGSPVGARVGAQAVEIQHGQVHRHDLREPVAGSTVRIRSLRADGLPSPAQVVLVRGHVASPASLPALLAGEAILLPEAGADASVLRRVPAGVYTLVILQGRNAPPRVVRQQVTVQGQGELRVDVQVPGDLAAAWSPAAG